MSEGKVLWDKRLELSADIIRVEPPPRRYLLTEATTGRGVFASGKVGLLAAAGGNGKSWMLTQLAVAVATGSTWLGAGRGWSATQGRVLLVLAEEDRGEALARLHYAVRAAGLLASDEIEQIARNITLLPLAGESVALTRIDPDETALPETLLAVQLRDVLQVGAMTGHPYSLVILDPLARFAGGDVEKDNAAATRFVQVVETLTRPEYRSPSVIIAHHLRKSSPDKGDDDLESADPIRGASALKDSVRWAAIIQPRKRLDGAPKLLRFRVVKTNYAAYPTTLELIQAEEDHGAVRIATPSEIETYGACRPSPKKKGIPEEERLEDIQAQVLGLLRRDGPTSARDMRPDIGVAMKLVNAACAALQRAGAIRYEKKRWHLVETPGIDIETETTTGPLKGAQSQFQSLSLRLTETG